MPENQNPNPSRNPVPPSDGIVPYAANETDVEAVLSQVNQKVSNLAREVLEPTTGSGSSDARAGRSAADMPPLDEQIDELESILNTAQDLFEGPPPEKASTPPASSGETSKTRSRAANAPVTSPRAAGTPTPSPTSAPGTSTQVETKAVKRSVALKTLAVPVSLGVATLEVIDRPFQKVGYNVRVVLGYAALALLMSAATFWAVSAFG